MSYEFDKELMFRNITFILSEVGKRIGEFEAETGVSAGYISRTSKDEKSKPGIDFVVNAAESLNVDIDSLIKVDYSALTGTERYLLDFLSKLKADTAIDKIEWECETAEYLNGLRVDFEGKVHHPLFEVRTFFEQTEVEYPEEVTRPVMTSRSFDVHTAIHGDCFHWKMDDNSIVYIMNISKSVYRTNDKDAFAKEIWMVTKNGTQFLCSNKKSQLSEVVDELYQIIVESFNRPRLNDDVKSAIDSFMAGTESGSKSARTNKQRLHGRGEV